MNEDTKLEYQELRDEFAGLIQMIATTVNFSVAGCIAIFGLIFKTLETTPSFWLFLLPLLIIFPSCFLLASRFQAIHRIAAYIIVFIEPNSELKFQTRLLKLPHRNQKLKLRLTILWIYFALILFDIAIFIFYGFHSLWQIIIYATSILLFIPIYRMINKGWSAIYIKKWKEVRDSEKLIAQTEETALDLSAEVAQPVNITVLNNDLEM